MINSLICPYCSAKMEIRKTKCTKCGVIVEGDFSINSFTLLSPEQMDFALTFLRHRGNLKDLENIYNLSYPTLRNRLAEIADVLNGNENSQETEEEREETKLEILEKLEAGSITFEQAMEKLKEL